MLDDVIKKIEKIIWATPQENISRMARFIIRNVKLAYFMWKQLVKDKCLQQAAALSFQTIFSLIPLAALSMYIVRKFIRVQDVQERTINFLFSLFNVDSIWIESESGTRTPLRSLLGNLIESLYSKIDSQSINIFGIIILALAALALLMTMENSINTIWGARQKRSIIKRLFNYWGVVTLMILLLGFSFYLTARYSSIIEEYRLLKTAEKVFVRILPFILSIAAYFFVYKLIPNTTVKWQCALEGAVIASILWTAAKFGFRIYVRHAFAYSKFYGSLGILPLFLFWVFIGWVILLFGAEIAYTRQHLSVLDLRRIRESEGNFVRADLLSMAVLYSLAKRFYDKKAAPLTLENLSETFNVAQKDLSLLADALEKAGLLARASAGGVGNAYVLARAPESIRLSEVWKLSAEKLQARVDKRIEENLADFWPLYKEIVKKELDNLAELTLSDLLKKGGHASPKTESQTTAE